MNILYMHVWKQSNETHKNKTNKHHTNILISHSITSPFQLNIILQSCEAEAILPNTQPELAILSGTNYGKCKFILPNGSKN